MSPAAGARPLVSSVVAWVDGCARWAAWCGMALLAGAVAVTILDVLTRRTLHWSVPGLVDITQLLVMSFVYFSIPFGFTRESNVAVEFVTDRFPPRGLAAIKAIAAALATLFMLALTYYCWLRALQQIENGDASQTIGIPFGWYWGPLLVGAVLSTVASALQLLRYGWFALSGQGDASTGAGVQI